jgi:hypothetical protein
MAASLQTALGGLAASIATRQQASTDSRWKDVFSWLETQPELIDSTPVYINIAKFLKTRENAEFIMAVPPERRADVLRELAEVERYSLPIL